MKWIPGFGLSLLLSFTLGSCGGDEGGPLDSALGYLPSDSALAVAVSTDLDSAAYSNLDSALQRFGLEGGVEAALEDWVTPDGISFSTDVRPLLGNELVIGIPPATSLMDEEIGRWVISLQVSDAEQFKELLDGIASLTVEEERNGATVYAPALPARAHGTEDDVDPQGPRIAVDDDVLVAADSRGGMDEALSQRGRDDRLTEEVFLERLGDLPEEGIVRAAGDAQSAIEVLGVEQTGSLPWIAALRSFGAVVGIGGRTLTFDAGLTTGEVSERDLPLAAGEESPHVLGERPAFANLDQSQTLGFAIEVLRASVPLAAYQEVTKRLDKRFDGDLVGVLDEFGEGILVQRDDGSTVSRTQVGNPEAIAEALRALHDDVSALVEVASTGPAGDALEAARLLIPALPLPDDYFFAPDTKVKRVRGEEALYRLVASDRKVAAPYLPGLHGLPRGRRPHVSFPAQEFAFGLIDDVFVTAPTVAQARRFVEEEPSTFEGPPGAFAVNFPIEAEDFGLPGGGAPDVTVSTVEAGIEASTTGVRLHAEAGL